MRALQAIYNDNRSISKKSAKTLSNKKEEAERYRFVPIYFGENQLISQMETRVQKKLGSKVENHKKTEHLGKAKKIIEGLFQKHEQAVKRLQKLKKDASEQMKEIYPFQPQLANKPQKFLVQGDIIRRNEIWLSEKKKRQLQKREQSLMVDMHRCTFTPELVSRYQSQIYLKNRDHNRSVREEGKKKRLCEVQNKIPFSTKKDLSVIEYEAGKKQVFNRLNELRH